MAAKHPIVFACMRIVCYNGEATFLLRQGVLPGDTHAVECFRRSFSNIMIQWEADRLRHSAHAKLLTTTTPSGKHIDAGITNYVDDTAEQKIISWQTGPTKAAIAERWAQPGVADVTLEKKKSSLIRVQHIKNAIGKADGANELAATTRQAVEEAQDRLAKHLEPHEIVLNGNKLETIPTLIGQSSRQATRELYGRGTEQG